MIRLFLDVDGENVGINDNTVVSIKQCENGSGDNLDTILIKTIDGDKYLVQGTLVSVIKFLNESMIVSFKSYYENEYCK